MDDVRNGSRNAAHRLLISAHDQGNTISACCHCLDDDCSDCLSFRFKTVGDMGNITRSLPVLHFPKVDLSVETLVIILPYSLPLAIVGLLESMLTATVLDEITDTPSNKNKKARGQGIANIVTGFFGGMAGCAMIGQSMINVKSGDVEGYLP